MRVRMRQDLERFLAEIERADATAAALEAVAEDVRRRVRAAPRFTVSTTSGVGPQGAYGQVVMRGPDAVLEEFGGRSRAARAPLRSALRGRR